MPDSPNAWEITVTDAVERLASQDAPGLTEADYHAAYERFLKSREAYNKVIAAALKDMQEQAINTAEIKTIALKTGTGETVHPVDQRKLSDFLESREATHLPERLAGTPENVLRILTQAAIPGEENIRLPKGVASDPQWSELLSIAREAASAVIEFRRRKTEACRSAWQRIMATGTALRPYRLGRLLDDREKCDLQEIDPNMYRGDPSWEVHTHRPRVADNIVIDRDLFSKRFARRPGRPKGTSKYDWPKFEARAVEALDEIGGMDRSVDPHWNQSALEAKMRSWARKNWGEPIPAESTIRTHVAKAIAEYRKSKAE